MKLTDIIGTNTIVEGVVALYTITEASWPEEWATGILNNPKIKAWLDGLGIVGELGSPKEGGVGRAYPIGDNHMLKLTTDRKEADAAAVLKGHDSPNAADVYDVKRLASFEDPRDPRRKVDLYGIVVQKLNTDVGKKMRIAANAVYDYLDYNNKFIEEPMSAVEGVLTKHLDPKYRSDRDIVKAVEKVIFALYDVQERTGVLSQDPHGGNVAFKGRNPAFFDFGRSKMNFDHPKMDNARITTLV